MKTEQLLQICVAMMAALATLMLGTSQDSTILPVVALAVAVTSLIFTDFLGWFYLHRFVAGIAGLIAGVNAFLQAQTGGLETQFISVANLLIHLQIILLFQRKDQRIYWQLITLGLLQVVVAAALNLFVLFGPLLVMYTAVSICAMLLFYRHRRDLEFPMGQSQVSANRDNGIWVETVYHRDGPRVETAAGSPAKRTGFVRHFIMLAISTVVVSAGVFLLMPRFGNGVWKAKSGKSQTGFSEGEMDLDDVGSIYESPTVVMRVSFSNTTSDEPYSVSGYPYFRGGVLDVYRDGKWSRQKSNELTERNGMEALRPPQRIYSAVRQNVHLETSDIKTVFTVAPACALEDTSDSMRISGRTLEVRYFPTDDEDRVEYSIGTLGFKNGLQSEYTPKLVSSTQYRRSFSQVRQRLTALTALADELVKDIPPEQVIDRARKLESYFTNGRNGFRYSLDPSPDRNSRADPVEDFVVNHKTGHCQYFASALALMLRSQGIASRLVQGYRADSYNVIGGYYQLREMDAHAWVEAEIPAEQVPNDEILPTEGIDAGAWLRLDPTPGDNVIAQSVAISPWRQQINDTMDYMQLLWSEYVLGLNEKRQRKAIYEPIQNAFRTLREQIFSPEVWSARWSAIRERLQGNVFTQENVRDSVIAIAVLTIGFYALRFLFRLCWQLFTTQWDKGAHRRGPKVEFYRKFESILAKHGIRRSDQQTPSEFAASVTDRLSHNGSNESLQEIPGNVVDLFYRVRFGGDRLDTSDMQRLESWLGKLQKNLSKS